MDYLTLKTIHQTMVVLSLTGFAARSAGALAGAGWVRSRAATSLPHVVDTALLLSALAMLWAIGLNPFTAPWLVAKIVGLLLYIVLGALALRPGRPLGVRVTALVLALATFGYIVSVALTKNPLGLLSLAAG